MALQNWVRRRSASAASVCVALAASGCNSVVAHTRNDDVLVSSRRVSSPTSQIAYSAEIADDPGQPIAVRAFQQRMCKLTEHQVVDRTIVTTKAPEGTGWQPWQAVVGGASLALGSYWAVQGVRESEQRKENLLAATGAGMLAAWWLGGYVSQKLAEGKSSEHVGQKELTVDRGRELCETKVPASEVEVRLVNMGDRSEIRVRTDSQGQAVVPEAEATKLDTQVNVYVAGSSVGVSRLPNLRGHTAALYQKQCDGGDFLGCYNLGVSYDEGRGVPQDAQRAAALYEKACKGGNVLGCTNLGFCHENGRGVPRDAQRATALYEKACTGGHAMGCYNLGVNYYDGRGAPQDERRAFLTFGKACTGGHAMSCYNLGVFHSKGKGGAPQDESRASAYFEKACEGGVAEGCYQAGVRYMDGKGVFQDERRAAVLYEKACSGGSAQGCYNLGVFHERGLGVSRDVNRAAALYERACDGGAAEGCYNLAVHRSMSGAPAFELYEKACKGGIALACQELQKNNF